MLSAKFHRAVVGLSGLDRALCLDWFPISTSHWHQIQFKVWLFVSSAWELLGEADSGSLFHWFFQQLR